MIISNPPWSIGQRAQSDRNQNQPYPTLDVSIEETYAARSAAGSKRALYDTYTRAIRWASDRVLHSPDGGIVAFVTNGGFIDNPSFDGFRKTMTEEFHETYVYNLRGNTRGSGDVARREGGQLFGSGSRATVAVLLLVKRPEHVTGRAMIRYCDIGDYLSRKQKLEIIAESRIEKMEWEEIWPNEEGDWINQRSARFTALRPLDSIGSQPAGEAPIFGMSTLGLFSGRDVWIYNSSAETLRSNLNRSVAFFNEQVVGFTTLEVAATRRLEAAKAFAIRDDTRFRWDHSTERRLSRNQEIALDEDGYRVASYRPFFRQHLYMDQALNSRVHQLSRVVPAGVERMPGIALENTVGSGSVSVLAVDTIPDLNFAAYPVRFFPRYTYDESSPALQPTLLPVDPEGRRDNINPDALAAYRGRLGAGIMADQIFAYVYGVLHAPDYRERYAADLNRLLPRIPDPADRATFDAFAEAGQRLLDLHIGYEDADLYPLDEQIAPGAPPEPERYRVEKMRWGGAARDPDRSRIVVNDWITLAGIPDQAHDYIVGPRSALAWLLDRYQVKTDKASGIVNDVNDWGLERGEPRYIVDLVKRIVTVSVETVSIVRALPELREAGT